MSNPNIRTIVVGDIITYANGVKAPVIYVDYDPAIQKYTIKTPVFSAEYCDDGYDDGDSGMRIASIDNSKHPLTIKEWAKKNPKDANLLCCGLGHVMINKE